MKRILIVIVMLMTGLAFANPIDSDLMRKKKFKINRRAMWPTGLNIYAGGPVGFVGASIDYFIVPKFSLEVGGGTRNFSFDPDELKPAFFGGGRYHFFGNSPLSVTPYVGIFSGFEYTGNDIRNFNLYVPFGIQRIKKNRVSWSLEVAYQRNSYDPSRKFYGGGKIGFRF